MTVEEFEKLNLKPYDLILIESREMISQECIRIFQTFSNFINIGIVIYFRFDPRYNSIIEKEFELEDIEKITILKREKEICNECFLTSICRRQYNILDCYKERFETNDN